MIGRLRVPMGIRIHGDSKIIGDSATLGDIGMIARPEDQGMACPIATPFIKGRSVSCDANASGALATIAVANTVVNW
jgi:hypothetical protein